MYVTIDFGSTNTRVASSVDLATLKNIYKFKTSPNLDEQRDLLLDAIDRVTDTVGASFIGIGIHGMLDKQNKKFIKMPNYSSLDGQSYGAIFRDKFDTARIFIDNDAAVAGLAESFMGDAKNHDVVAYLTISTGIGGVRIVNKELDDNSSFEPGHQIIVKDGKLNEGSGIKGDFEIYASGLYFKDNFGVEPELCEDDSIWHEYSSYLGVGIHNIINLWSPGIIVLGGGIGYNKFEYFFNHLVNYLEETKFGNVPPIVRSHYGDDAGLYGALSLLVRSKSS